MLQESSVTIDQWFNGSIGTVVSGSTVPHSSGSLDQWFTGSVIQWFSGPMDIWATTSLPRRRMSKWAWATSTSTILSDDSPPAPRRDAIVNKLTREIHCMSSYYGSVVHWINRYNGLMGPVVHLSSGSLDQKFNGPMVQWSNSSTGLVVHWSSGSLVQWFSGPLVQWINGFSGPVVHWITNTMVSGPMVWATGLLVHWYIISVVYCFSGPMVQCVQFFSGPVVHWSSGPVDQ